MNNLKDFKNELRLVNTDSWGCAMDAQFEVAGQLYVRGVDLPESWNYKAGYSPLNEDSYFYEIFENTETDLLMQIGLFLERYLNYLKFKGLDY